MDSSVIFIDGDEATPSPPAKKASRRPRPASGDKPRNRTRSRPASSVGNLSVLVPGAAQLLRGEWSAGLCTLSLLALFGTLITAATQNIGRLSGTLPWLEVHPVVVVRFVICLYAAAALVYLFNVVQAKIADTPRDVPPWAAGMASLALPGFGQVLSGNLGRATVFLAGVWFLGGVCLIRSSAFGRLLEAGDAHVPQGLVQLLTPATIVGFGAVLWSIAIYDAASGAIRAGRHR